MYFKHFLVTMIAIGAGVASPVVAYGQVPILREMTDEERARFQDSVLFASASFKGLSFTEQQKNAIRAIYARQNQMMRQINEEGGGAVTIWRKNMVIRENSRKEVRALLDSSAQKIYDVNIVGARERDEAILRERLAKDPEKASPHEAQSQGAMLRTMTPVELERFRDSVLFASPIFRGLTFTEGQKQSIRAISARTRSLMSQLREDGGKPEVMAHQVMVVREQSRKEIRALLDADAQKIFDKNAVEARKQDIAALRTVVPGYNPKPKEAPKK